MANAIGVQEATAPVSGDAVVPVAVRMHMLGALWSAVTSHLSRGQKTVAASVATSLEVCMFAASAGKERIYRRKMYFVLCMLRRAGRFLLESMESPWKLASTDPAKIVLKWNVHRGKVSLEKDGSVLTGSAKKTLDVYAHTETSIRELQPPTLQEAASRAAHAPGGSDHKQKPCRRCGHTKHVGYRYQNRRGDEGMAYYLVCLGCGLRTTA